MESQEENLAVKELFVKWLNERLEKERQKDTHMKYAIAKAISHMRDYEGEIRDEHDAVKIKYVGPGIAKDLGKKLLQHQQGSAGAKTQGVKRTNSAPLAGTREGENVQRPLKRARTMLSQTPKVKSYMPRSGTKPWAILATLKQFPNGLHMSELVRSAIPHEAKGDWDKNDIKIASWRAPLNTLISRGLVLELGQPPMYKLSINANDACSKIDVDIISPVRPVNSTANGTQQAPVPPLALDENPFQSEPDNPFAAPEPTAAQWISSFDTQPLSSLVASSSAIATPYMHFEPLTYDIVVVVDKREVKGRTDKSEWVEWCRSNGLTVEERALDLADIIFVARRKPEYTKSNELCSEIVLDLLVERKQLEDLDSSIFDGRYIEQKSRLLEMGYNCVYLVEGMKLGSMEVDASISRLYGAIGSTQVQDNFCVYQTKDLHESAEYIQACARRFERICREGPALKAVQSRHVSADALSDRNILLSFTAFMEYGKKKRKQTMMECMYYFMTTIKGVSNEKAMELAQQFETPRRLIDTLIASSDPVSVLSTTNNDPVSVATARRRVNRPTAGRIARLFLSKGGYEEDENVGEFFVT